MAKSTAPQSHAKLIREFSRETSRSSRSSQHSDSSEKLHFTQSDFDPDNEALMSTRRLDGKAHVLPGLRDSARKYSRFSKAAPPEPQELDYAINTSAIGRAFPDFSQGGSSEASSMSIEVGRGKKDAFSEKGALDVNGGDLSSNMQLGMAEDSLDFSVPMIGNHEVMGTPPLRHRATKREIGDNKRDLTQSSIQSYRASGLRNEVKEQSAVAMKSKDYGSSGSARSSEERGRSLAAMHARVRDENDQSFTNDHRPPTIDLTTKNTRFGLVQRPTIPSSDGDIPTKFSSRHGLGSGTGKKKDTQPAKQAASAAGTQQSFILPDMPNISELISGVYEDGTPVFSRQKRSRASRFTSGQANMKPSFANIDEVPVPKDEQAIFLSLKLLQDKVAMLEKDNVGAQMSIQDLQQRNDQLLAERESRRRVSHRSDSALGTTDSEGGEGRTENRKVLIEKSRLESNVRALRSQLDAANRRAVTAETILHNITQERDSAVSQLGVAYVTIEQLKAEIEDLKGHVDDGAQLEQQTARTALETKDSLFHEKRGKASKNETAAQPAHLHTNHDTTQKTAGTIFDLSVGPETQEVFGNTSTGKVSHNSEEIITATTTRHSGKTRKSAPPSSKSLRASGMQDESSRNLTYLSFLDSDEVAKLRRTLEQERIERKQRRSLDQKRSNNEVILTQVEEESTVQDRASTLPKTSSIKNSLSQSVLPVKTQDATQSANGKGSTRRHSETSFPSDRSRRRALAAENATSAFIVPDITIRRFDGVSHDIPQLSVQDQARLNDLAHHVKSNCLVCKKNECLGAKCKNEDTRHEKILISKPIPVSERQLVSTDFEEEPTMRPSQTPGLALATVIKGLEDEVGHLKIELARYQALFNGHDPAISRRKRKYVSQKIEFLSQEINVKSDQIYALYDVLEGQKQDGNEMSQQEVEATLQSVLVDTTAMHLRGGAGETQESQNSRKSTDRAPWDLDSEDSSDDDLPWEGFEPTTETTADGLGRTSQRGELAI